MALRLYHDPDGLSEITKLNPDTVREAVLVDGTLTDVREIYLLSDNPNLTYEVIILRTIGDKDDASVSGEVDIMYSLDGETYSQILALPDGDYEEPLAVYRKVVAPSVTDAFRETTIEHEWDFDEFVR